MKSIFLLLTYLLLLVNTAAGQSFDNGMDLYNDEQYAEAAKLFSGLSDEQSLLFAGKSYLALSEFSLALPFLESAAQSTQETLRHEAEYSLALTQFGLGNYDKSLQYLYYVAQNSRGSLRNDARNFYGQILDFLTAKQRFDLLYRIESYAIRYDLVNRSRSFLEPGVYRHMVSELIKLTANTSEKSRIERELLTTGTTLQPIRFRYPSAPAGTVYNIGIILPTFEENDPDFTIPRNLYFGMLLAADDFNSRNTGKKVNLIFRNSAEHPDTTAAAFKELAFSKGVSAVVGPLFSEPAIRLAELAEEYRIPMLAPLANADDLNRSYNYTFQLNPTLETHGRQMARFAVQELRLNRIAIFLEEGMAGRASAVAFQREAESLGARITYFIEDNFAPIGYDLSEYTELFTRDAALIDSLNITPSQAIYAPFSGQASRTMMNLLLNDLEAMGSNPVILGSEEWQHFSLTEYQQNFFEVYYSQSFGDISDQSAQNFFRQDYETRFGRTPDMFSKLGFDTGNYLFRNLEIAGNPEYLSRALRTDTQYDGLVIRIRFDGERMNQNLRINGLSNRAKQRLGTE
jgi:ABC-type branched-subunit amino acid transport system substrate-binding protein